MMKPCTSFASNTSIYEDVDEYLDGRRKSSVIVVRKGRIPPRHKKGHIPPRYIALTVPHESSAQIFDDLALNGVANAKLLMRCASAARDRANLGSATRARRSVDHRHSVSRASFTPRKSMSRASVQLSGVFHNDPSHSRRNLHKSSLAASHTRRRVSNRNNSLLNCSSLFIRFETSFAPSSPNSDVLLSHSSLKLSGADSANGARRDGARSPSVIRNEESVEVSPERAFQPLAPNLTSAPLDATHPPLYPRPSVVARRAGPEVRRVSDAKPSHPPLAPKPRKSVVINAPEKPPQQQQQRTSIVSAQSAPQRNGSIQSAPNGSKPAEPSTAARVSEVAKAASEAIKAMISNTAPVKAEQTPRPSAADVASARSAPRRSSKADPSPAQPSQSKPLITTGNGTRSSITQPSSVPLDKSNGTRNVLTTSAPQQQQKQTSAAAAPAKPVSAKPSSTPAPVPPKPSSVRNSMVSSSRNGSLVPPRPALPMKDRAVQKPKATTNNESRSARSAAAVATSSRTAPDSETHVLPALKARNTNTNVPTTNNNSHDHKQPASSNGVVTSSSTDSQTKAPLPSTRISTAPPRQQAQQQQQQQHRSDVMSTTTIHPTTLMRSSAQVSSESAGGTTTISGSSGTTTTTTHTTTTTTNTTTYTSSPSGFSYHKHNNSSSATPPFTPSPAESGQNSPQSGRVHPVPSSDVNSLAPSSASPGNTGDNMDLFPFTRLHVNAVTRRRRTASHIKPFNSDASQYDYNVGTPNTTTTTSAALRPVPSHDTDSVSNRAESMFEAADFDSPLTELGTKPIPPPTPPQPLSHAVPSHYSRNLRPLLPSQPPSPLPPSSRTAGITHGPRIITNATVVPRDSMDILTGAADEHTGIHSRPARVPPVPPTTTHVSSSSLEALHSPVCVKKDKTLPLTSHALPTPSSRSNSPGASLTQTIAFESQDDVRRPSVNDTRNRTPSTAQPNTGSRPKANAVQPTMSNHNHISTTQQAYTSASNGVDSRDEESTQSVPRLTSRRQRRVSEHAHGRHLVINQL